MTSISKRTTKDRVEQSLRQLGFPAVPVSEHGDGNVTLSCIGMEFNDLCIVKAATKTIVGVRSVTIKKK